METDPAPRTTCAHEKLRVACARQRFWLPNEVFLAVQDVLAERKWETDTGT